MNSLVDNDNNDSKSRVSRTQEQIKGKNTTLLNIKDLRNQCLNFSDWRCQDYPWVCYLFFSRVFCNCNMGFGWLSTCPSHKLNFWSIWNLWARDFYVWKLFFIYDEKFQFCFLEIRHLGFLGKTLVLDIQCFIISVFVVR